MDLLGIFHAEVVQLSGQNGSDQRIGKAVEFHSTDVCKAVIILIAVGIRRQCAHILIGNDGSRFHQLSDIKQGCVRQFHFLKCIVETDIDDGAVFIQVINTCHQFGIDIHPLGNAFDHTRTVHCKSFGKRSDGLCPVQNKDQKARQVAAHLQDFFGSLDQAAYADGFLFLLQQFLQFLRTDIRQRQ